MKGLFHRKLVFTAALLATACSTPQAVKDLAEQSAAKTTLIAKDAKTFAAQRRSIAEERASRVGRIKQLANANTAFIEEEIAIYTAEGSKAEPKMLKTLETLVSKIDTLDQGRVDADKARDAVLQSNTKIEIDASAATETSKALAKLIEDKPALTFIEEFSKEVMDDIRIRTEDAKAAAEKGDDIADDAATALESEVENAPGSLKTRSSS